MLLDEAISLLNNELTALQGLDLEAKYGLDLETLKKVAEWMRASFDVGFEACCGR